VKGRVKAETRGLRVGMTSTISIDGSYGEGGGQILRSTLALSAILGRPVQLRNIRSGRRKPGLQPQHLASVHALARITGAEVRGAELGSTTLHFAPGPVAGGSFRFEIATAGAASLVFQTVIAPLVFARTPSVLTLTGGTHVPWSPPAPYVSEIFLPAVARTGVVAEWRVRTAGFYPRGGGEVEAIVQPLATLDPLDLADRGRLVRLAGVSAVAKLPRRIAERQADRARRRLADAGYDLSVEIAELDAVSPGDSLFLWAEFERSRAGFGALGERGKPAEQVADEAAEELVRFLDQGAATDPHLADQLVLFMGLASGRSVLTTSRVSHHLLTNVWTVKQFLPVDVSLEGQLGEPGRLSIGGLGIVSSSAAMFQAIA
jgi:RNA 3'-terminal phosphate cyclase (ATP)